MRLTGEFTTPAPPVALAALGHDRQALQAVPAFHALSVDEDGTVVTVFTPTTPLGRLPLSTRIQTREASAQGAVLRVTAWRAQHAVDATIELRFVADGPGSRVLWEAELTVRGPAASVGQRVAREVATRAIGQTLQSAAALAAQPA
ncbi:SRPBCC domain-containing protein [Streptomyces sp. NPDC005474]|uniref:SRPBCC domain-containing protein n=1 Tax=Streptomyces sp. NPDC005474 TaxID=3154878 RepID=UPI00345725C1